jgi:hypothetical protein
MEASLHTKDTKGTKDTKDGLDPKDPRAADGRDQKDEKADSAADGMMAGVVPGAKKKDEASKLLPVTPWGRYMKVLLSSSEFLFIS